MLVLSGSFWAGCRVDAEAPSTLQDGTSWVVGWDEGSFEVNFALADRQPSLLGKNEQSKTNLIFKTDMIMMF